MKILMVAMPSLHFFRWTEQLQEAGHEVFWFDITDGGKEASRIHWVKQIVGWKLKVNYPLRYRIKKNWPYLYQFIQKYNEREILPVFEKVLDDIKPDIVHSFEMIVSGLPILKAMDKNRDIKWVYSSWGSDMYYFNELGVKKEEVQDFFSRVDYLITDCKRDYNIAIKNGFYTNYLGVFPGNGGIQYNDQAMKDTLSERNIILIKGYNTGVGKGIYILKALSQELLPILKEYDILVFGANEEIEKYVKTENRFKELNIKVYPNTVFIPNPELIRLMGKSYLYLGNSSSDGIPNTMLEAMGMGAFPIQSNPGNATSEVISHGENGLLITNPEDSKEIEGLLKFALQNRELVNSAFVYNTTYFRCKYERKNVKDRILKLYEKVIK